MSQLFNTSKQNISQHLQTIFEEEELQENSVVKKFLTTAVDGKSYQTQFYNLDAIIAVSYRINSKQATKFRIWANHVLREFIIKGFVIDDERLKQDKHCGKDILRSCSVKYARFALASVGFIRKLPISTLFQLTTIKTQTSLRSFLPPCKTNSTRLSLVKLLLKSSTVKLLNNNTWV